MITMESEVNMKVHFTVWMELVEKQKGSPFMTDLMKYVKMAAKYEKTSELRDEKLEAIFLKIIAILEKRNVFEFEESEGWKEKLFSFYDFCKKAV